VRFGKNEILLGGARDPGLQDEILFQIGGQREKI